MLGLKSGTVKLVPHNQQWARRYTKEKRRLLSILRNFKIQIDHIGSTAVAGIIAKPILDITIAVWSREQIKKIYKILEQHGYKDSGKLGIVGRRIFIKKSYNKTTHHLHVTRKKSEYWKEHIIFRDYLLAHKGVRLKYQALKKTLAKQFKNDRTSYTKAKSAFIQNILGKIK